MSTPELDKALDAVHAARDGSPEDAQRAIAEWHPRVKKALQSKKVSKDWLHLAVDLGKQLERLDRTDEARLLFCGVIKVDPLSDWGKKADAAMRDGTRCP